MVLFSLENVPQCLFEMARVHLETLDSTGIHALLFSEAELSRSIKNTKHTAGEVFIRVLMFSQRQ